MSSMMKESTAAKVPVVAASAVERPGFTRTCSLLSRYLKEKGSLGDLNVNLNLNLNLNFLDASSSSSSSPDPGRSEVPNQFPAKTMNLFPESKLNDSSCLNLNKDAAGKDPEMAPMTIFYAGNVIVFDDFPAERAKEVMIMASRASILGAIAPNLAESVPLLPATESVPCGLPIARRASLHRFLEKRKDRLMTRVPYQKVESPAKAKAWLEQAARSLVADTKY